MTDMNILDLFLKASLLEQIKDIHVSHCLNAENTLLNEAEVLVVCVDPLKMKPRALPKSIVAEFKQ